MATLNFPDEPTTGDIYNDSNSGFSYEWNGTVWISTDPQRAANIREIDNISSGFDGSDTTFTLQVEGVNVEPANAQQLIISVGGVMQNAGDDFTVSGSTLTFTTAPTSGLTFFGTLLGSALSLNTVADGSVGSASLKTEDFTIGGSSNTVTIPGNLTVQGTETIINTERLDIQDKTVGIASTNAPTSTSQDDAGIIIYGETDVNILYDRDKAALGINTSLHVSGVTTCGSGLSLTDNVKAKFGASGDLEIYHDGSHSRIQDKGTGYLILNTNTGVLIKNGADDEGIAYFTPDGACEFMYDNTKRIETASDDKGGGVIVTGKIVGTAATIGSGVTINNTGIDAGIGAGIITASSFRGSGSNLTGIPALTGSTNNTVVTVTGANAITGETKLTYDGTNLQLKQTTAAYNDLIFDAAQTAADQSIGLLSGYWDGSRVADIIFKTGADTTNKDDGVMLFRTAPAGGEIYDRLKIDQFGGFKFSNGLFDEKCKIVAGQLSDNNNINLIDGMVYYFSTAEDTTATPNIRIDASNTLQDAMDTGDVCTVTIIIEAAAAGYYANVTIDGNAVTEEWVGGSAPDAGSADGLDIYTYTIICIGTGTGDSGFKVIANMTNATN